MQQTFDPLAFSTRLTQLKKVLLQARTNNSLNSRVELTLNSISFIEQITLNQNTQLSLFIDRCIHDIYPILDSLSNLQQDGEDYDDGEDCDAQQDGEDYDVKQELYRLENKLKDLSLTAVNSYSKGHKIVNHIEGLAKALYDLYEPKVRQYKQSKRDFNNNSSNSRSGFISSLLEDTDNNDSSKDSKYSPFSSRPRGDSELWTEISGMNDFRKRMNQMFIEAICKELESLHSLPPTFAYGVLYNYCMNEAILNTSTNNNPFIKIVSMNEILETKESDVYSVARVIASAIIINS